MVAECGMSDTNTVATPGLRLSYDQLEKDEVLQHTCAQHSADQPPARITLLLIDPTVSSQLRKC